MPKWSRTLLVPRFYRKCGLSDGLLLGHHEHGVCLGPGTVCAVRVMCDSNAGAGHLTPAFVPSVEIAESSERSQLVKLPTPEVARRGEGLQGTHSDYTLYPAVCVNHKTMLS
jgi:hypothetical protein